MKKIESNWWKFLLLGVLLIAAWKLLDFKALISWLKSALIILMPFIIGAVLALLLLKPTRLIEKLLHKMFKKIKHKSTRPISVLSVYIIFFTAIALILKFLIPALYRNTQELISNMPKYYAVLSSFFNKYDALKNLKVWESISERVVSYFNIDMMGRVVSALGSVAGTLLSLFLSIIISIYILLERESLANFFKDLIKMIIKGKRASILAQYSKIFFDLFYSYFAGLLVDAVIIGSVSTLFFYIFGAPYPLMLGLVVAVGNMIPFFGPIISAIVVFVACVLTIGPLNALWVLIFQIVLGQIDANLIQPRIISNSVGISPFWVILAVTLFGGFWGPVGMFIGVPIVAALKILYNDYKEEREIGENLS